MTDATQDVIAEIDNPPAGGTQVAEIEALRAEVEDYRKNGAVAVKCAPLSAYWSGELRRLFGDDAREGIDSLEQQYCDSLARVEQLANALKDIRNLTPINFTTNPDPFTLVTLLNNIRNIADAALSQDTATSYSLAQHEEDSDD